MAKILCAHKHVWITEFKCTGLNMHMKIGIFWPFCIIRNFRRYFIFAFN